MITPKPDFLMLSSDDVFAEGMLPSDVESLWRRLAILPAVQKVARGLASDPDEIRALCDFVDNLLREPYDSRYRHPNDIAICAALVILEQSPLRGYLLNSSPRYGLWTWVGAQGNRI